MPEPVKKVSITIGYTEEGGQEIKHSIKKSIETVKPVNAILKEISALEAELTGAHPML